MKLEKRSKADEPAPKKSPSRLRELTAELHQLEARLRLGGGNEKIEVDVRVLAATHRDLEIALKENQFREDLFYRLGQVLRLPPLRERIVSKIRGSRVRSPRFSQVHLLCLFPDNLCQRVKTAKFNLLLRTPTGHHIVK